MSSVVQAASGSSTGSSLVLTFPSSITSGNSLIVALVGYVGGTVSGISISTTAGTFSKQAGSSSGNCEIWANLSVGISGATTVTVTTSTAGIIGYAYEVLGALNSTSSATLVLDKTSASTGSGTSWISGATSPTFDAQQEFQIGIGGIFNNTGSITGPSTGGWINRPSITNIVGTQPIGAVSGYKFSTGSSTPSYGGTATAGSNWAGCVATFLCAGKQPGWGGLVFTEHDSYTGVSASFVVPPVTSAGMCSIWVGLGNIYQTGIFLYYDTSMPGNGAAGAWTWVLPGSGELWDHTAYPISVNDNLRLTVTLGTNAWDFTIANATKGWAYTQRKSVEAANVGATSWIYPPTSATVIVEKEGSYDNPNYGTVAFSNVSTTPSISGVPAPIVTVNTGIDQYPGPFLGGAFTMYWNGAN